MKGEHITRLYGSDLERWLSARRFVDDSKGCMIDGDLSVAAMKLMGGLCPAPDAVCLWKTEVLPHHGRSDLKSLMWIRKGLMLKLEEGHNGGFDLSFKGEGETYWRLVGTWNFIGQCLHWDGGFRP